MQQVWDAYQSTNPDPEPGGSPELPVNQIGHLMRSSVYDLGDFDQDGILDHNYDEDTKFFTNSPLAPT